MSNDPENSVPDSVTGLDSKLDGSELLDVTDPAMGIYEHLPLLNIYLVSLSSSLSSSLSDYLRCVVQLEAKSPTIGKFDPITRQEERPIFDRLYRFPLIQGTIAIAVPACLIFRLVDVFFGGTGEVVDELGERELSGAEASMLDKVSNEFVESIVHLLHPGESAADVADIESWSNQEAAHSGNTESMVAIKFTCTLGEYKSEIELWLSLTVMELLLDTELLTNMDGSTSDVRWTSEFKDNVFNCQMELKCALADQMMPLRLVSKLNVGDFIPIEEVGEATFSSESRALFKAKVGMTNERASARFIEWI